MERTVEEVEDLVQGAMTFGFTANRIHRGSWNEEQLRILISRWDAGDSCSIIAEKVGGGKTRNAIIGKVHRMGLARRGTVGVALGETKRKPKTPKRPKGDNPMDKYQSKKVVAPKLIPQPVPLSQRQPIGIMSLNDSTCRAVVGHDDRGVAVYCGDQTFSEKPFCEGHCAMYYETIQARQQRRR